MFWPIFTAVIVTILVLSIFSKHLENLETTITEKFSEYTARPRWFTIWVLAYGFWVSIHKQLLGHTKWYTDDTDLIILTGLFSAVPFWVENSLKASQAKFQHMLLAIMEHNSVTLRELSELTFAVKAALDRAAEKDETFAAENDALFALVQKIVNKLEEV